MSNISVNEKSRLLLEKGDFAGAIKVLKKELEKQEDPTTRNNLAMAYYEMGKYQKCLDTLTPNLRQEAFYNPFAHSLAVMALTHIGEKQEAEAELKKAITAFDKGWQEMRYEGLPADIWGEYTVIVLRAAGILQNHYEVYELYRRWQNMHSNWESTYLGGVAAFNLKKYTQAAKCWAALSRVSPHFLSMQRVALLCHQRVIPSFTMNYQIPDKENALNQAKNAFENPALLDKMVQDGIFRMLCLELVFSDEASEDARNSFLQILIEHGDEWGHSLGKSILGDSRFDYSLKTSAAYSLVKAGFYQEGEPIPAIINGEETALVISGLSTDVNPTEEKMFYQQLQQLLQNKDYDTAAELIESEMKKGHLYPDVLPLLARIYYNQNDEENFSKTLHMLHMLAMDIEDPDILLDLIRLYGEIGETDLALEIMDNIDNNELTHEQQSTLYSILHELYAKDYLYYWCESRREKIEDKPLSIKCKTSRGLKNMPVEWLNAACTKYGINPARLRKERENQIEAHLNDERNLTQILQELDDEEHNLLVYLLEKQGYSPINTITRKFGSMVGDGFYWNEAVPESPLARLWLKCLVFVGRTKINNRNTKIATIPGDLLTSIEKILTDIQR